MQFAQHMITMRKGFDIHFYYNMCVFRKKSHINAKIQVSPNNVFPLTLEISNKDFFRSFYAIKLKL